MKENQVFISLLKSKMLKNIEIVVVIFMDGGGGNPETNKKNQGINFF